MGTQLPLPQRGIAIPPFSVHICCGQMAAWVKMLLGMELGLGLGDFVLDGDEDLARRSPPKKGGGAPQIFGPCLLWPNGWMDQDSTRCGFCPSDIRSFEELLKTSDEQLFGKVIHNRHHLLYKHLPPPSSASQNYDLRPRIHINRQLPDHPGHLTDCNFFIPLLYNEMY